MDIIDTELLDAFEEYSGYGNTSVERVRFVLMKLAADKAHGTEYFVNKFVNKIQSIFNGLPKPKEWQSFLNHDLPLLTSIDDDVQEISILAIRPRHFQQRHASAPFPQPLRQCVALFPRHRQGIRRQYVRQPVG